MKVLTTMATTKKIDNTNVVIEIQINQNQKFHTLLVECEMVEPLWKNVFFFFFLLFNFIFKLYNIVLVFPNIEMNPPQVYMCFPS